MRVLIILLVAIGIGLTAWLSLRGTDPQPSGMEDGKPPPRLWWTDALGAVTSPFASAVNVPSQSFDLSSRDATLNVPPGKGPRVARFKLESGTHPVPILFKDATLYLLPDKGEVQAPPCASQKCVSGRRQVTLAVPDEGGPVTLKQTPDGKVLLVP